MKNYKLLLSKKEYVLLIVEAKNEKEAISKAYNDDFIEAIYNSEKLPIDTYSIEKIDEQKKLED